METLALLIPVSLFLALIGLLAFVWTLRSGQYDDPEGDSQRILNPDWEERPKGQQPGIDP
ncbi:MAG: cbb3-type cytochrome oxidase assembly protein CcoS [Paracoccaceae bacterium]